MKFMSSKEAQPVKIPALYSQISQPERARVREEYIRLQKGKCWFCQGTLTGLPSETVRKARLNMHLFPSGFLRHPIHLHHDHKSDLTLGAVHAECNAYLWQYLGE